MQSINNTTGKYSNDKLRSGFTLIELLVIIAIMAVMTSVGVVSLGAGRSTSRLKGASRDIYAAIRLARSTALVTGRPCVITFATVKSGDDVAASVKITGTQMLTGENDDSYETLSGEEISEQRELVHIVKEGETIKDTGGATGGTTLEDVLFSDIDEDILTGIRIKVAVDDEEIEFERNNDTRSRHRISVFSNVDYLLGKFKENMKSKAEVEDEVEGDGEVEVGGEDQEPVSLAWQANGRCSKPHRVWIYADGSDPDSGLVINVDRYGAVKIVAADEEEP